jgi:hypothetical protein
LQRFVQGGSSMLLHVTAMLALFVAVGVMCGALR